MTRRERQLPSPLVFITWKSPVFKLFPAVSLLMIQGEQRLLLPLPHSPFMSLYSDWLRAGRSGFDSRRGLGIVVFDIVSRPALDPTQSPIQWVPGDFSLGVKRLGREADHLPPSEPSKNAWSYTSNSPIPLHGMVIS